MEGAAAEGDGEEIGKGKVDTGIGEGEVEDEAGDEDGDSVVVV